LNTGFEASSLPKDITVVGNDTLYLTAVPSGSTRRLVKVSNVLADDVTTITRTNIAVPGYNSRPFSDSISANLTLVQNVGGNGQDALFFVARATDGVNNEDFGRELMRLDNPVAADAASTAVLVRDIQTGTNNSNPLGLVSFQNKLYFAADDGNGTKLWYSDGTSNGTNFIDIGGGQTYTPSNLTVVGNTLFLVTDDGSSGVELWKTSNGTSLSLVQDLNPDGASSNPQNLVKIGTDALFFIADNGTDGLEVWSVGSDAPIT
jgi:ELWxxDGT repeat protein